MLASNEKNPEYLSSPLTSNRLSSKRSSAEFLSIYIPRSYTKITAIDCKVSRQTPHLEMCVYVSADIKMRPVT